MNTTLLASDRAGSCSLPGPPPGLTHGIVSHAVMTAPGLRLTLLHFAAGQELSEHTSTARAVLHVTRGSLDVVAGGETRRLRAGDLLHLPARAAHAVVAPEEATLFLIQSTLPAAN